MAATNYTPIQLYHSTTASAVPVNTNLVDGELAINIADGKLYYKDSGGTVQVIATKGAGTIGGSNTQVQYNSSGALAGSANFTFNGTTATINTLNLTNALGAAYGGTAQSTYTQGDLLYASASNTLAKLAIGSNTYILTSNGTIPGWAAPSSISVNTATNLAGGAGGSVPYQSGAGATTFLSIGTANQVMTSSGSLPQWSSGLSITTLTASDAVTFSATTQNIALGTSQTTGTFTVGGASQTGALTLDQSTKTHTLNLGTGATESGLTKTINLGTGGVATSTTAINIGSANGTTTTVSGAFVANGGAVFNENGADVDFRVEGDTDANLFFADASTDRVGVGTATPSVKFDVAGVIRSTGTNANLGGTATTGNAQLALTTNARIWTLYTANASSGLQFRDETAGLERMQITPTGQVNIGGNFTSTNNTLQVTGNAAIGYTTAAPTTGLIVAGNVGIGTDSPQVKLHALEDSSGGAYLRLENARTSTFDGDFFGQVQFSGNDSTPGANGIRSSIAALCRGVSGQTDLVFSTAPAAGAVAERMRLDSSGTLILRQSSNAANTSVSFNTTVQNALTLDSSGNLGLGVTPSVWNANNKSVIQLQNTSNIFTRSTGLFATSNFVYNSADDGKFQADGYGLMYQQNQTTGAHVWINTANNTSGAGATASLISAMTLNASGNLLVGTTTTTNNLRANQKLAIVTVGNNTYTGAAFTGYSGTTAAAAPVLDFNRSRGTTDGSMTVVASGDRLGLIVARGADGTNFVDAASIDFAVDGTPGSNDMPGRIVFSTTADGASGTTERARITSGGDFRVKGAGTAGSTDAFQISGSAPADAARLTSGGAFCVAKTAVVTTGASAVVYRESAGNVLDIQTGNTINSTPVVIFYDGDNTDCGSIDVDPTANTTAYTTSSDYRLKENVQPMADALKKVEALKPCTWTWKDGKVSGQGFIAHELAEVCPQAVVGEKDAVDAEGNPQYQGIDTSFLVATLTAAIQEQQAMINELKAEVAALKGV